MHLAIMLGLMVPMIIAFRRGYLPALACAVFYWVATPSELRLPLPGGLPQLTFHRLLVATMLIAFLRQRKARIDREVLCRTPLIWMAAIYVASMLLSSVNAVSLKATLSFVIETVLFYFVMARSLHGRDDVLRILRAATLGLVVTGCFTWLEKYGQVNAFERLLHYDSGGPRDITASYRNRILLGYAMAMAMPLVVLRLCFAETAWQKRFMAAALCIAAGACYFSNSRGPWLGIVIASAVLSLLGGCHVRRVMRGLVIAIVLLLVLRPGVWGTISNLLGDTSAESHKGRSYNYRWELWGAAWEKINVSPEKLALGYGPLSHESMDLSSLLSMGGNIKRLGYTSMDNHYAAMLLELGVVGLAAAAGVYIIAFLSLLKSRTGPALADRRSRLINAALLSGMAVYIFAMTNVYIFAPQLDFLFWTLVACGHALTQHEELAATSATAEPPESSRPVVEARWA